MIGQLLMSGDSRLIYITSPVAIITRSCDWSYCDRSGLLSPKILVRLSAGGVGVGVGVGFGVGAAARAATGDAPVGPLTGAAHAATRGSTSSGTRARRFKRR